MNILVTGGAGYVGSHAVQVLAQQGHHVLVYDNLSTGNAWAVRSAELFVGDLADNKLLSKLMREYRFDAVLHFAASVDVEESVTLPLKYYYNNTVNTLNLIQQIERFSIPYFILSSTAAVYGSPCVDSVGENQPPAPISPYGSSKMMAERICIDASISANFKYIILRYFNVAGADPGLAIGQATPNARHLIKAICEVLTGKKPELIVFGDDYNSVDGTCIRDYIHVHDLAHAHILALEYLVDGGQSDILNCGYGHGYSVYDVIASAERASGQKIPVRIAERRQGDPPKLLADSRKIRSILDWKPKYDDLDIIITHALQWEKKTINSR